MKKSILSATGLAVALAFSMPALGNAAATTTAPVTPSAADLQKEKEPLA